MDSKEETKMKGNEQAVDADVVQPDQKVRQVNNPILVDHPTQLICIWIFICQHTNTPEARYILDTNQSET